jgi:uncharacterized protein HemX
MSDLKKILDRLTSLEERVSSAKETQSKSSPWAWVMGLILTAAVSIGVGLLFRQINKRNKELAKLRTEAEQRKVKAANLEVSSQAAASAERQEKLDNKAKDLKKDAAISLEKLDQEETKLALAVEKLMEIKTWKELDYLNSLGR